MRVLHSLCLIIVAPFDVHSFSLRLISLLPPRRDIWSVQTLQTLQTVQTLQTIALAKHVEACITSTNALRKILRLQLLIQLLIRTTGLHQNPIYTVIFVKNVLITSLTSIKVVIRHWLKRTNFYHLRC